MADVERIKRNIGRMIDQGAPEADIDAYVQSEGVSAEALRGEQKSSGGVMDMIGSGMGLAKQAGYGAIEGLAAVPGAFGDVQRLGDTAGMWLREKMGRAPLTPEQQAQARAAMPGFVPTLPATSDYTGAVENVIGPMQAPQNVPEEYTRTAGRFILGAAAPGGPVRKVVGGVLAPALASEAAGQAARKVAPSIEPWARVGGAVVGGALGALRRPTLGAKAQAERRVGQMVTPETRHRLTELGDDAFLFEGNPTLEQVAQGVVQRPGAAAEKLRTAVTARHALAPERLQTEIQQSFGRPVSPSRVQTRIDKAQQALAPDYRAAVQSQAAPANVKPIVGVIDQEIAKLAGAPKKALVEIKSFLFDNGRLKTGADELLSVRQAIDDMIPRFEGQKNALRVISETRQSIDDAIRQAAPSVKAVDARFAALAKQGEALQKGGQVLATGKEAIRPSELAQQMRTMTPAQKASLRMGTRAEVDRVLGTALHDVNAVRGLVKSEGKWNHNKLAQIFGVREADKVMSAIDREVAFRGAYDRLVANSQTAPRMVAEEASRVRGIGDLTPEAVAAAGTAVATGNIPGAVAAGGGMMGLRRMIDAARAGSQRKLDNELVRLLGAQGPQRDRLLDQLAAARAARGSAVRESLIRSLLAAQGASAGARARQ